MSTDAQFKDILLYTPPNGAETIEIIYEDETFWLSQKKIAQLFNVSVPKINAHLKKIFQTGELEKISAIRKFLIVQHERNRNVKREIDFYNLDAIVAVGYRINSYQANQFRIWATNTLKQNTQLLVAGIKHISEIKSQRYKNLDLGKGLKLSEGLNIFIGSNGSGKSNFISLLKFLKDSLSGEFLSQKDGVSKFVKAAMELGETRMLSASFSPPEKVNLTFSFFIYGVENNLLSLYLSILCYKDLPQIVEESLYDHFENQPDISDFRRYLYKFHDQSSGHGFIRKNNSDSSYQLNAIPTDEVGLFVIPQLLELVEHSPKNELVYTARRLILSLISDWRFYSSNNMNLKDIRNAMPEIGSSDQYLNSDCQNLALVLDNLIQESIDFEEVINIIMRDIVPKTRRIRSIRIGRNRIDIEWHLHNTKRPLYLDEMSDGTVRMLCWAIILNSPNLPSLIVIDEPEVGLHVQWLSYLAEWIKNAAARTQVIITTHSPDLLDKFTDRLENVHVFEASNPEQTLFHVKTLSRERLQDRLDEGWELGDLYRVGEPEVGGWAL